MPAVASVPRGTAAYFVHERVPRAYDLRYDRVMRTRLILLALLVSACAAPQPSSPQRQAVELAGRTAGAARDCIPIVRTEALRVSDSDPHTLLYGMGKTIWANNLGPNCGFAVNDALITEPIFRYCKGDIVRSADRMSRIPGPSCALNDFVPYTR